MIEVIPHNATSVKVRSADFGIEQEISEFFTFFAQSYKYAPAYRSGQWDGKIRLFNQRTKSLPKGLLEVLVKFAKNQDYKITIDPTLNPSNFWGLRSDVEKFVASLDLHGRGKPIEIRDYQIDAIEYALGTKRSILVAATSSGKSAMIYSIIRYHETFKRKTLLIVPNISLVKQMYSDFADYSSANGWSVEDNVQMLYSGKERVFDSNLVISTWQTILSMMKTDKKAMQELVDYADVIIGDECIHPESMISMADGTSKPIKEIKVGELVITVNETTNSIENKPVVNIHHNLSVTEKKYKITTIDGKTLLVTGNHKIMTTNRGWVRADELLLSDDINILDVPNPRVDIH